MDIMSRLVSLGVAKGQVEGLKVRKELIWLSHLQFANDTIFSIWSRKVLVNLNGILSFFETISILKINRGKISIIGLNRDPVKLNSWASLVGCAVNNLPCSYLGLPLGGNLKYSSFWSLVAEKV